MATTRATLPQRLLKPVLCHPFRTILASVALVGGVTMARAVTMRALAKRRSKAATIPLRDKCLACEDEEVSIFCLNTLAPNLVSKQRYRYVPDALLIWAYRFRVLCDMLAKVRIHKLPG